MARPKKLTAKQQEALNKLLEFCGLHDDMIPIRLVAERLHRTPQALVRMHRRGAFCPIWHDENSQCTMVRASDLKLYMERGWLKPGTPERESEFTNAAEAELNEFERSRPRQDKRRPA